MMTREMQNAARKYTYTIGGVTFDTEIKLPDHVQKYIADWAQDPCWEIWSVEHDPRLNDYEEELRDYARLYEAHAERKWQQKLEDAGDLDNARDAHVRGDYAASMSISGIHQAESLRRISDILQRHFS